MARIRITFEALPKREPQHRQSWRSNVVDHGVKDEKGRAIGGCVEAYEWNGGFRVYVRATRDGRVFGAIPRSADVATLDHAKQHGEAKLIEQRARYAKQFGKPATLETGLLDASIDGPEERESHEGRPCPYCKTTCREHGRAINGLKPISGKGCEFCNPSKRGAS